jgi:hypothetical protein
MIEIVRSAEDAISAEAEPSLAPTAKTHVAANGGPLAGLPCEIDQHGYAMHYGNARAPMIRVVPDDRWPGMWRMIWPDGQLSDMANLSRIKDAAAEICDRGPPRSDRRCFRWKVFHPESAIAQG